MDWKRMLCYISGSVNEELLLRNEYLASENRILRGQIKGRLRLTVGERKTLAEIGKRLGKKALEEVASIVRPETILSWHRRLVAQKFDGTKNRGRLGRPRTKAELEGLIIRLARENRSGGYDRIAGALSNLGYKVSDRTVGNILKRNALAPAPERRKGTTWQEFIRTHRDLLFGTDFFTAEVWTAQGLVTYYVILFIRVATRQVYIAGITAHPNEDWIAQIARNITMEGLGFLRSGALLIHDRDRKFCPSFRRIIESLGVRCLLLPARSPNLNAFAERWIRSIKEECLSRVILFGEESLRRAIREYVEHYHHERNHQGRGNLIILPAAGVGERRAGRIRCRPRLGGLLNYYDLQAA